MSGNPNDYDPSAPFAPPSDTPYVYQPYTTGTNPEYNDLTNLNPTQPVYTSPAVASPTSYDYLLTGGPTAVNTVDSPVLSPQSSYVAMTPTPAIDKQVDYVPPEQTPYVSPTTTTPIHQNHVSTSSYTPTPTKPSFQMDGPDEETIRQGCTITLIVCGIIAILGIVGIIVFFPIWLGVFFGLANPEIIIKNTYTLSTCQATANSIGQGNCCSKSCTLCSNCGSTQPYCSGLTPSTQGQNSSTGCCNGYYCCRTCCSTCVSCSSSGRSRSCYTYSCNCYCCQSVTNQVCDYRCNTCWKPTINVAVNLLNAGTNSTVASSMSTDCGTNYGCVNNYLNQYPIGKQFTCIYNPSNPSQFLVGDGSYNKVYFDTMYAFAGLSIASIACMCGGGILAIIGCIYILKTRD